MLKIGDIAPGFTLKNHLGEEVTLAGFAGKTVVLWWYPAADTPG